MEREDASNVVPFLRASPPITEPVTVRRWLESFIPLEVRAARHRKIIQMVVADAIDDIGNAETETVLLNALAFTRMEKDQS